MEPTRWQWPDPAAAPPGEEALAVGADLEPGTLRAAYSRGLFPMPTEPGGSIGWWSPDPRGILPLDSLRVRRSLRRVLPRFTITVDQDFEAVMRSCADPARPLGWIDEQVVRAYVRLHRMGWAHSVEARDSSGALVGGLYGVEVGGLFAGESMFHRVRDASKAALVALVGILREAPEPRRRLLDVQWRSDHLASMGALAIPRSEYLLRLGDAVGLPPATWPAGAAGPTV